MYVGLLILSTDHQHYDAFVSFYCTIGVGVQVGGTAGGGYPLKGHYLMMEACPYALAGWNKTSGPAAIDRDIWFQDMKHPDRALRRSDVRSRGRDLRHQQQAPRSD